MPPLIVGATDLAELLGLQPSGEIRWGLARTRRLLDSVGQPHLSFRALHIGGTNGKGSVAAMAAAVLERAGHSVGLYTSPHLIDFAERVRVNGRPVAESALVAAARRLLPLAEELGATFFETTTALAFLCFAEADVDFVVAEVGLGGRLDSTNVLLPEVAAITNVAWDHADYLGHSLSSIAGEKAGIAKPAVPLVLGRLEPEAARIVRDRAARVGASVVQLGQEAAVRRVRIRRSGTEFEYVGPGMREAIGITCPLTGAHQAWNAGLAALALQTLPTPWRPTAEEIREGIASVRWPGRLQIEEIGGRTWVLDVAHNAVGVEALAQALTSLDLPAPLALVVAIMGDKPWPEMLPPLLSLADEAVFTVAPSSPLERRWDPASAARSVAGYPVKVIEEFGEAMDYAEGIASTVVVTGSNYTVGDAMRHLKMNVGLLPVKGAG